MRLFRRLVWVLPLAFAVFVFALYLTQDLQIYPRAATSLWSKSPDSPLPSGVERSWLMTPDGCRLEVWREAPSQSRGVVLMFHGNGDTLDNFYVVQDAFVKGGYTTYALEFRGFGRSSCWPSEVGLQNDVLAGASYVTALEKLDPKDLIVYGFSLGTGPASWLAAKIHPRKLLLAAPFTSLPDTARWRGFPEPLPSLMRTRFENKERFAELGATDVLIVATRKDRAVPYEESEALPTYYKGSGHVDFKEIQVGRHWDVAVGTVVEGLNWLAKKP